MNLTEKLREFEELGPRGGYANLLSLARELHRLLVQAEGALRSGKLCAEMLAERGGAVSTEILEEELPRINKTLAALHAAGIGG